jgi:uroporphyrinogen III methyltransferase/synthase
MVCLVGAGPGDPGLITVAGLDRLRRAEVLVYDALANPLLLLEAPPSAQRIDVGKRSRDHKLTQDGINDLLVAKANEGHFVVRLKGGDPYLFGRGAEEAAYLAQRGIACEIIPGITSGIAAPAAAGIPVTHRKLASTVTFVTGHEDPTKDDTAINYDALAQLVAAGGTACFYMGVARLPAITQSLTSHGLSPATPAAVVQWGTLPRQRSVRSTLADITTAVTEAGISSPAIIVVGPVAAIDEPGLDYFTQRPLFGQRILITRTRQQASDLRLRLAALGADVLEAATIELVPPADWTEVDAALKQINQYDWLVLTSANAVEAVASRLQRLALDARHFAGVSVAAIGQATADALTQHLRITADLVPTRFVAESLAGELIAKHGVAGKRMLLLRADIARPALPKLLAEAGALVTELTAYETRRPDHLPDEVLSALREKQIDWVTFTSSSTAQNMVDLLGHERDLLQSTRIASIGPITSETARQLGLTIDVEAQCSDIQGLVDAVVYATEQATAPAAVPNPRS